MQNASPQAEGRGGECLWGPRSGGRIPDPLSFGGSPWLIPAGWLAGARRGRQGNTSSLCDWRWVRRLALTLGTRGLPPSPPDS